MKARYKTLLTLAALTGATLHVINRISFSRATMMDVLPARQDRYYEWRFGKIRYTKKGSGAPMLLLHDLTAGSSLDEFNKLVDKVSQTNQVYCIDLLGYGLSEKPNMTHTNYLYVQLVSDFIKYIIGRKATIMAVGDAFPIAVLTCHNDNNLVRDLIGINPQDLYQMNQIPGKQAKLLKFILDCPVVGTFLYNLHTSKSAFRSTFAKNGFYDPSRIDERLLLSYAEAAHVGGNNAKCAYASHAAKYTNASILHALKELNNNMYLISGEEKKDAKTIAENYLHYNSAAECFTVPKTKQLPHIEQPQKVFEIIQLLQ